MNNDTRQQLWARLPGPWDVLIIGGGITGAGILREASRAGLRALLVEAHDFAGGTSSRSSKMVHGGLRYLQNAQVKLTFESVRERERLQREARGLVTPLGFLLANFRGDAIPGWVFGLGLIAYDALALQWGHRRYDAYDIKDLCPVLRQEELQGGYRYFDAQTDDARLVLRLIQEAAQDGGLALNYAPAISLLRTQAGRVCGAVVQDNTPEGGGRSLEVQAGVVINATGAWADDLRRQVGGQPRLRRLRGSHLVFPTQRLPLSRAVSFLHPQDGRPVFAFPWEGVTLLGTTDVDLAGPLTADPAISPAEVEYLLRAVQSAFPCQELDLADVQATFAGVRPVIDTGRANPSKESREHVLWSEQGLLTVAGGKLTTFRLMALDALRRVAPRLPGRPRFSLRRQVFDPTPLELPQTEALSPAARLRLVGRHGRPVGDLLAAARPGEIEAIGATPALWAELRWAARAEAVIHLDDLLLRRVRLGLLLPHGGQDCLDDLRPIVQPELGWDDERWAEETTRYADLWQACYHLPR